MSHLIGFRIKEAARYTGLTVKMVDYLCRREIVVPSTKGKTGRGRARSFTFGDLVFMKILNDFLARGITVEKIRKSLVELRKETKKYDAKTLPERFLASDGASIFFMGEKGSLIDLTQGDQFSFTFLVDMQEKHDAVILSIRNNRLNYGTLSSERKSKTV